MLFLLYVATALVAIGLMHRFVRPLSWAAAVVLFVLPLGITGYAVAIGGVYGPVDYPYQTEPLKMLKPVYGIGAAHNFSATDVYGSMFPWRRSIQLSLQRGEWPLWNAYMLSGHLLAGSAQGAPYSPFTLIACLAPTPVNFTFTACIALFIAAIGAFYLARELDCSEGAALVAAAGWAFAASTVNYVLTAMGFTNVYEPLLFLGALSVVRRPGVRSAMLLMIVLVLMVFSGHPETLFLAVVAASACALFELARLRTNVWRAIATALVAGALALLVSAIHLLPFFEAVDQSAEYQIKKKYFTEQSHEVPAERVLAALATDLFPYLHVRVWEKPKLGFVSAETVACGSLILALAIYAVWRRRSPHTWFFGALGLFCTLIEIRWRPAVLALKKLPLMSITYDERLAFTGALCLAILAAIGLDTIVRRRDFRAAALTLALVLIALTAGTMWLARNVVMQITFSDFGDYKIFAELFFLGAAALVLVIRPPIRFLVPAMVALLVSQRVISEGQTFKTFPAEAAYPPVPIFEPLKNVRAPFRIVGQHHALLPGTNVFYGLEDVRGFEALHYMPHVQTWPMWCVHQVIWFNRVDDIAKPFLSMMNTRYAIVSPFAAVPEGWRTVAKQRDAVLLENTKAFERAFIPQFVRIGAPLEEQLAQMQNQTDFRERAWITAEVKPYERDNGPGRVSIAQYSPGGRYLLNADMQRDGWIVISESAWKGWRAYVDGKRVKMQNANAAFLSVHVPAGRHEVRVVFWPESFVLGRAITFGTIAVLIVFGLIRRRRRAEPAAR